MNLIALLLGHYLKDNPNHIKMNLHEYQGKQLLASYDVAIQNGEVASTVEEAIEAYKNIKERTNSDFAIVKAWKGDTNGNLIYKATARNFNPLMAMGGKITIAEVEELVEPGTLDSNHIHTPGIFVQRIFQGIDYEKRIEQRTVRQRT